MGRNFTGPRTNLQLTNKTKKLIRKSIKNGLVELTGGENNPQKMFVMPYFGKKIRVLYNIETNEIIEASKPYN